MVDNALVKQMLEKAGIAEPFYFGGNEESYFWRAAEIEGEIFAERARFTDVDGASAKSFYCLASDRSTRRNIYDDMVIDFVVYYRDVLAYREPSDVFEDTASPDDVGLCEILSVFHKKYSDFVKDVIYWFSVVSEMEPNRKGVFVIYDDGPLCSKDRVVKTVLDRLMTVAPLAIETDDTVFVWRLVRANSKVWYQKTTYYYHDEYDHVSNEYGYVAMNDIDAFSALRESVCSCFYIDGWLLSTTDEDVDEILSIVDLSLEEVTAE